MAETEVKRFEGYVSQCVYHNFIDRDFPVSPTIFRLSNEPFKKPDMRTYALTRQNKPPMLNGQRVEGLAVKTDMGEEGTVFIIDTMSIFDSEGRVLASYDFGQ